MFKLFIAGGFIAMSILTVELIALLLAAWKAPAYVKEIGLIALMTGFVHFMFGFYNAADAVEMAGDISPALVWGGFKVALISITYGCLIYIASLIIRIMHKPRI